MLVLPSLLLTYLNIRLITKHTALRDNQVLASLLAASSDDDDDDDDDNVESPYSIL
jgi:hypothetical protein